MAPDEPPRAGSGDAATGDDAPRRRGAPKRRAPRTATAHLPQIALIAVVLVVLAAVAVTAGGSPKQPTAGPATASDAPSEGAGPDDAASTEATPTPSATVPEIVALTPKQLDRRYRRKGMVRVDRPPTSKPLSFTVATLNVLGASHTKGRNKRKGFAGAMARLPGQVQLLKNKDVSIAGLQELQVPQASGFEQQAGDVYDIYPGMRLGPRHTENSIVWRKADWVLVRGEVTDIPYFGGRPKKMPHVLLRHRTTGHQVWVGNYHNAADVHGPAARWRRAAERIEADLARTLGADGTPVLMTGDFNDHAPFACNFTALSGMHSADGARTDKAGRCRVPQRMYVDWILGTTKVQFSEFTPDFVTRDKRLSDHPVFTSVATLPAPVDAKRCRLEPSTEGSLWYCPK
ncbi:hypothetical protein KG112_07435 [Nocardioides sp. zg-ZUI104]|uniref:endonuclease/exonuclease/phosphatase family protein n=1 Tax=Nocardioides faecalis TaxID=2803858 RepID=UPI001BCAF115|nr:endonuclease/exonuclease/phosphatase family protein [Nocardioides faecalis]MBS4752640.1 hypothetical protein [Nocardioides faecalis]